ncbi:SCO6880 family protein [Kitasatospora griseola]|uniref:SCO6880 family protein n=1 Tax=Kitasatospora griseola TaxID=2064 RepID=UPI0036659B57
MTTSDDPQLYGGWQPERSSYLGELSLGGLVLVAGAGLAVMMPIYLHRWVGEIAAVPVALVLLALVYVPVRGISGVEWLSLAVRHQINVARRRNVFLSGLFAPRRSDGTQPMDLPGVLARLRLLSVPTGAGEELGVVFDPRTNCYSAVMEVRFPGLALVDTTKANARVGAWGAFLRSHCVEGGPIVRIAVHDRSLPDDGTALMAWTAKHLDPTAPQHVRDLVADLTADAAPVAAARRTYLTITMSATRARLAVKGAGGGELGACAVLVRELLAMQSSIAGADLEVVTHLTSRDLAEVIRTAYDPHAIPVLAAHAAAAQAPDWQGLPPGVEEELAGPAAAERHWSHYRHDHATSRTYHVHRWPEGRVYASVLQPLLKSGGDVTRSFTMTYECLSPRTARTVLRRERTKRDVKRRVRAQGGKIESLDERQDLAHAQEQDSARVAGHGIVRFTGLVTVTVDSHDPHRLATAHAQMLKDAADSGVVLRELVGVQDAAFAAAALPLGLGLPEKRRAL